MCILLGLKEGYPTSSRSSSRRIVCIHIDKVNAHVPQTLEHKLFSLAVSLARAEWSPSFLYAKQNKQTEHHMLFSIS